MGRKEKKGKKGNAANFMTRNQALKRLQVSLQDFRRLCILKGIYPRVPRKKVHGNNKTYYYTKDIKFLAHEQLLGQFRDFKAFVKKIKRAVGRHEHDDAARLDEAKPQYKLDHLIKERYPSFIDALRDLDDALCLVHLFSMLPQTAKIPAERTKNCERLALEFQNYIIRTNALRKTFLSIKGTYYQAEVFGQQLTWLVPYQFSQADVPADVDYRVMLTFLEFYETLLKFVNYKLYHSENLKYPPVLNQSLSDAAAGLGAYELEDKDVAARKEQKRREQEDTVMTEAADAAARAKVADALMSSVDGPKGRTNGHDDDDEEDDASDGSDDGEVDDGADFKDSKEAKELREAVKRQEIHSQLFKGKKIFLSREVPRHSLEFVVRSFGGEVGWAGEGSPFDENDQGVTHMVVDRSSQKHRFLTREYVQPQWVYDCANEGHLLDPLEYMPGARLPPHLSPFVNDDEEGYKPEQREKLDAIKGVSRGEDTETAEGLEAGDAGDETDDEELAEQYEEELAKEAGDEAGNGAPQSEKKKKKKTTTKQAEPEENEDDEEDDGEATPQPTPRRSKRGLGKDDSEKELAKTMMSKKDQRLYNKMQYGKKRKQDAIDRLHAKRAR